MSDMPMTAATISISPIDDSNPYFSFDPSRCIVCSRCVRACDEIQGTFALTIEGRGFNSQMVAGQHEHYLDSECVSCGACVQACPTDALMEKSLLEKGRADRAIVTTCGYCGVGCSFKAEVRGDEIVRMVPNKDGLPNHGHSCVKGRFAWGYATHPDRVKRPMIRKRISDPWQEVSWEEALSLCRRRVQARPTEIRARRSRRYYVFAMHQRGSLPRAEAGARRFRQQQCRYLRARLPFAHRLWPQDRVRHARRHAGFRFGREGRCDHGDWRESDRRSSGVRVDHEAPPAQWGASLIVADPREIELMRMPHVEADYFLQLTPGTNVALFNAMRT